MAARITMILRALRRADYYAGRLRITDSAYTDRSYVTPDPSLGRDQDLATLEGMMPILREAGYTVTLVADPPPMTACLIVE